MKRQWQGRWRKQLTGVAGAFLLAACSSAPAEPTHSQFDDPWEPVNRAVFSFNETVDGLILKPAAQIYTGVVPLYGRERVHAFLTNLRMPVVFANSVLQRDPANAFSALWSFLLNTTFGVLGLYDWAGQNTDLVIRDEDFGQTLGTYGTDTGPYLVLPLIGPSSVRHTGGRVVDWFLQPVNWGTLGVEDGWQYGKVAAEGVDARAATLDTIDEIYRTSFDPYATIRSGYFQRRIAQTENRSSARVGDVEPIQASPFGLEPPEGHD